MRKLRDLGRRLLIVLLLASAVLLLRHTGYYAGIRSRLERSISVRTERTVETAQTLPRPAALLSPLAVTVRAAESGGRCGIAYDAEALADVFQRFSVDLGEALGSAGSPAEITEEEFRAYLNRSCVVMHYPESVRLELLSGWLGLEMSSPAAQHAAEILCLSASETEALFAYRTDDGTYYACTTAVNAEGLRGRTAGYAPNGALYAWESEQLKNGGYMLLLDAPTDVAVVKSAVPLPRGGETDAILTALGMNSFVTSTYTEADGTVVYVSDETTMRISPTGAIFFRRAGSPEAGNSSALTASVSRAWQTAEQCLVPFIGDGALHYAGAQYNAAQRSETVLLDYVMDAIPVRLASGHAAEIVVRGGEVIQARLQLRQFTLTEAHAKLLPCLQAAAIAERTQGQAELIYADAGDATECMWVITDG